MEGNNHNRRGVIEAYFYFIIFKIYMHLASRKKVEEYIGFGRNESPADVDIDAYRKARSVRHAIASASKYVWWKKNKDLLDALVAKKMMLKRNVQISAHLGVRKNSNGQLVPHAWTRCGFYYVTGISREGNDSKQRFAASE